MSATINSTKLKKLIVYNCSMSRSGGCGVPALFGGAIGIASLAATFLLGPIDFVRTTYNVMTGDMPALKRDILDYARRDVKKSYPTATDEERDFALTYRFGARLRDGQHLNVEDVGIADLWDAAEDHARSSYQRWVWPFLKDD